MAEVDDIIRELNLLAIELDGLGPDDAGRRLELTTRRGELRRRASELHATTRTPAIVQAELDEVQRQLAAAERGRLNVTAMRSGGIGFASAVEMETLERMSARVDEGLDLERLRTVERELRAELARRTG